MAHTAEKLNADPDKKLFGRYGAEKLQSCQVANVKKQLFRLIKIFL